MDKLLYSYEEMLTEIFNNIDHSEDYSGAPLMYILSGSVGCGKSTLCRKLTNHMNAMVINKDSLLQSISGDFYGRFDSNKIELYDKAEETLVRSAFEMKQTVIIDRLNYNREERKRFIDIAKEYSIPVISYDFGSGSKETLERRLKNNRGVPARVWIKLYDLVKQNYEAPSMDEGIVLVKTPPTGKDFKFFSFDFDGTLVKKANFPAFGEKNELIIKLADKLYKKTSNILILWTCRCDDALNEAITFLNSNRTWFDYYNENPIAPFKTSNKIYSDVHIDDKVLSIKEVRDLIENKLQ